MSTVPTWEQYMAPALRVLLDGEVHRARQICNAAADDLGVSEEERQQLIPSGQPRYLNRSLWALSYLSRAGAVERPVRGQYRINELGRALLAAHAAGLTERDLRELPGYVSPYVRGTGAGASAEASGTAQSASAEALDNSGLSPTEQVEQGIQRIHGDVATELLTRLHAQEPAFFEQAVLDLLMAMGYGGAEGQATRTQLSYDGGIDGIIDQDALGLSRVYVQAKRYAPDATVGRPEVQGFVGALHGNQASQGVFITTGRFTGGAQQFADTVVTRVVLIDGARLTRLMIRYRVGASRSSRPTRSSRSTRTSSSKPRRASQRRQRSSDSHACGTPMESIERACEVGNAFSRPFADATHETAQLWGVDRR